MRTTLFLTFFLLFSTNSAAQELIGPDFTLPGSLASFEVVPAQEASWHIVSPTPSTATYQIDTGSSKFYFASPVQGRYTVIAGIVVDGRPELLVRTFINGAADGELPPIPFPIPTPPVSTLEAWIKTQLPALVKSENLVAEAKLVAECFEQIVQRIEAENIRTVQNAQAQLQITLTGTLALASPTAVTEWMPFLTELSRQMERELRDGSTELEEVQKVLQEISDVMRLLPIELPVLPESALRMPVQNIDNPNNRVPGMQNRVFRPLLAR